MRGGGGGGFDEEVRRGEGGGDNNTFVQPFLKKSTYLSVVRNSSQDNNGEVYQGLKRGRAVREEEMELSEAHQGE